MPKQKKKTPSEQNYRDAVQEIEQILEAIDRDETDIDELSTRVERAVELIRVCQEKLRATEMRVTKVLQDLDQPEEAGAEPNAESATKAQQKRGQRPKSADPHDSAGDLDVGDKGEDDAELPF